MKREYTGLTLEKVSFDGLEIVTVASENCRVMVAFNDNSPYNGLCDEAEPGNPDYGNYMEYWMGDHSGELVG